MSADDSDSVTIASEGLITLVGNVLSKGSGLIFLIIVTRLINPSVFGTFVLALSIVMIIKSFFSLGAANAIDYFIPQYLHKGSTSQAGGLFWKVVKVGLLSGTAGVAATVFVSFYVSTYFNSPNLDNVVLFLSIIVPLGILYSIILKTFASIAELRYRVLVKDISRSLGKIVITAVLAVLGFEIAALVGGEYLALFGAILVGWHLIRKNISWVFGSTQSPESTHSIINYSTPLMLSGILLVLVNQIDLLVIGYFMGSEAVGLYRVQYQLAGNLVIVLSAMTPIFKPIIAESNVHGREIAAPYKNTTRWGIAGTLPIAITLVLAPNHYLRMIFTEAYVKTSLPFLILVLGNMINIAAGPDGQLLSGLGKTRINMISTALLIILNFVLNWVLVQQFGIIGAALGTSFAIFCTVCFNIGIIYMLVGVHQFSTQLIRVFLATIVPLAIGALFVRQTSGLVLTIGLPIVVITTYVGGLIMTSAVTRTDLEFLRSMNRESNFKIIELLEDLLQYLK
jgi:O-antigen/teichoic acid export membrane protein